MSTARRSRGSDALAAAGLLLVLASAGACLAQPAAGYWDTFDLPDSSLPAEWAWTGFAEGGGSFLVYDGAFTHVGGGPAYYYRIAGAADRNLGGCYELIVKGSYWVFAWRISPDDASAGRCLWLSHDDRSGSWAYTFAECSWENLDPEEYPDGAFMWHNATAIRSVLSPTPGPLDGWHTVTIFETGPNALQLDIRADGQPIFDEAYEYIPEGYQGLGSLGSEVMSPAFDSIWAQWPDAVEDESWSRVKALYR
jgi:hypothetical protein